MGRGAGLRAAVLACWDPDRAPGGCPKGIGARAPAPRHWSRDRRSRRDTVGLALGRRTFRLDLARVSGGLSQMRARMITRPDPPLLEVQEDQAAGTLAWSTHRNDEGRVVGRDASESRGIASPTWCRRLRRTRALSTLLWGPCWSGLPVTTSFRKSTCVASSRLRGSAVVRCAPERPADDNPRALGCRGSSVVIALPSSSRCWRRYRSCARRRRRGASQVELRSCATPWLAAASSGNWLRNRRRERRRSDASSRPEVWLHPRRHRATDQR